MQRLLDLACCSLQRGSSNLFKSQHFQSFDLRGVASAAAAAVEGLGTVRAETRAENTKPALKKLRKGGKTPAILFSLPGNKNQLLAVDAKFISREVATTGSRQFLSKRYNLQVEDEGSNATFFPVIPRQVHRNAVTDVIENVTFMFCPSERTLKVAVPLQIIGEDVCPGLKQGGFVNIIKRTIDCICPGDSIPPFLEVDVSELPIGARVRMSDLVLPEGVRAILQDPMIPVCKIAGKQARE